MTKRKDTDLWKCVQNAKLYEKKLISWVHGRCIDVNIFTCGGVSAKL